MLQGKFAKYFWGRIKYPFTFFSDWSCYGKTLEIPTTRTQSPLSKRKSGNYMLCHSLTRWGVYTWKNMLPIMFATRTSHVNEHDLNLSERPAETFTIMHAIYRASNPSHIPQQERALLFSFSLLFLCRNYVQNHRKCNPERESVS